MKEGSSATIQQYLRLMRTAHRSAALERDQVPHFIPRERRDEFLRCARASWATLRDARVFHVEPRVERIVYHLGDRAMEQAAGGEWKPFDPDDKIARRDTAATRTYLDACGRLHADTPYPAPLPFVFEHIQPFNIKTGQPTDVPATILRYYGGTWHGHLSLAPYVVPRLVRLLYETKTAVVSPTPGERLAFEHAGRKMQIKRMIPKPYYVLNVDDRVVAERLRQPATGRLSFQYTYRFDVAGHERMRVAYGTRPIAPKVAKLLARRRYTVYVHGDDMPQAVERKMHQRGLRLPMADEWCAVLVYSVKQFQKGPEGSPYVPAMRRMGKRREHRAARDDYQQAAGQKEG